MTAKTYRLTQEIIDRLNAKHGDAQDFAAVGDVVTIGYNVDYVDENGNLLARVHCAASSPRYTTFVPVEMARRMEAADT